MKHVRPIFYLCAIVLTILSACGPQSTPTGTEAPGAGSSSASSGSSESSSSVTPVNLAGPEMKVGGTWLYADGSILVAVPHGIFIMGRNAGVDNPQRPVNLPDFWIYRAKVTNAQFAYCVSQGQCTLPNLKDDPGYNDPRKSQYPVAGVNYDQAAAYCTFVHGRLPTEAEWEKTARGPDANIYPWGNGAPACDLLNFETCAGDTTPVNKYPQGQSFYTAFDMEGNTFEWVADFYKADYYLIAPEDSPVGPEKGSVRSVRSSAFNSGANQTPAYSRFFSNPGDHRANLGFRCVVEDPTYFAPFCNYPATYGTDGVGGGPSDTQVKVDCPNLSIQQSPGCIETSPSTIVTFNGPPGSTITAPAPPACNPNANPNQYTCTKDGTLSICSQCTITLTGDPQCPEGYQYDPETKSCKGQLGTGPCLPGVSFGELTRGPVLTTNTPTPNGGQCCAIPNGPVVLTTGSDLQRGPIKPFCPAGTNWDGNECIGTQVQSPYCNSVGVDLLNCQSGGGEGSSSSRSVCQPPSGGCGVNYKWDTKTCSCVCNGC